MGRQNAVYWDYFMYHFFRVAALFEPCKPMISSLAKAMVSRKVEAGRGMNGDNLDAQNFATPKW